MRFLADATGSGPSQNTLPALGSWISTDAAHVHEALLGLASVAVVVWTAGFLVRALGHKPNRGLVAGMTYAQLAFMGALAAAFLTPLALQALAFMFLALEIWQTPYIVYTWRRATDQRTYAQQQMLDLYGLTTAKDVLWYTILQIPYVAAVVTILVWPSSFIALPLLWLALYGSYQILTSFLYYKPAEEQAATPTAISSTSVQSLGSLQLLADTQRNISSLLDNTAVAKAYFAGHEQDHTESVVVARNLDETALAIGQFFVSPPLATTGFISASGYVYAMIRHRSLVGRLYFLVTGVAYQPQVAISLIDEIRGYLFYDLTANGQTAQLTQFVQQGTENNIAIRDARLDTTTRSYSVSWLGQAYLEEANAILLSVNHRLVNVQPSPLPSPSDAPPSTDTSDEQRVTPSNE
jgi:hypothetical protein